MAEFIGIDIGGTNIRAGAVDNSGRMGVVFSEPTLEGVEVPEDFLAKVTRLIEKIPNYKKSKAIGIGFPGMIVDNKIITGRNLPSLIGFPLCEGLEKQFKKKVFLQNDAKLATMGEALVGAGKDGNIVCYVGLGTGVGGGVVINKHLYAGSSGLGGYFSRMIMDGENQCERLIGGAGLLVQAQKIFPELKSTTEFFRKYIKDKKAQPLIEKFKKTFLNLLLNISITLNPDTVVLGGGVMRAKEYFLDDVINSFKQTAHGQAVNTKFKLVELNEPGVVGAALYAKDCLEIKNKG